MITRLISSLTRLGRFGAMRVFVFRKEVGMLWRAFRHPATPVYLKLMTIAAALYLVSPIDLIPEFIPVIGILDDLIIVPLLVGWIAKRVPPEAAAERTPPDGPVVEGTARRL